jgi:ribosomal protein S27AE
MPEPVQVWMPFQQYSPVQEEFVRDYHRAQEVWRGEDRVWLFSPSGPFEVGDVVRWHTVRRPGVRIRECATRGEGLNAYTLYHVDERRHIYPCLGRPEQSWHTLPEGLYRLWVNSSPRMVPAPSEFTWDLPRRVGGRVIMTPARVKTDPAPLVPWLRSADGHADRAVMGWPPPSWRGPSPISPETESPHVYGKLRRERIHIEAHDIDVVLTEKDPDMVAIARRFIWPDLFGAMFPLGGNIDLLYHRTLMRQCIHDLEEGRRAKAMRAIESWVQRLTGHGEAQLDKAWFMPKCMASVSGALIDLQYRFGFTATDLGEFLRSSGFSQIANTSTEVRRTHGWLGFFWWELYADVRNRVAVRFCKNCGDVIRGGHADRQYCSRKENAACFRARNRAAQKKSRATTQSRSLKQSLGRVEWT